MKFTNLKAFEKALQDPQLHETKVFLVMTSSDDERKLIVQKYIDATLPKDHDIERFSSEEEFRTLSDAILTCSLFSFQKVIVLEGVESFKKKDVELLADLLETQNFSNRVILSSKGKTPLSKIVDKCGAVLDLGEEKPWDKEKRLMELIADKVKQEGKWISSDALTLLTERIGLDLVALTQEVHKLVCFVGDRPTIDRSDIFKISPLNHLETPWQMAEEIVWENSSQFDPAAFQSLIFALRSQIQMGLKITSLHQEMVPFTEWSVHFPKVWPRTLEKRRDQALQRGPAYFQRGLMALHKMESFSRNINTDPKALFDLFLFQFRVGV